MTDDERKTASGAGASGEDAPRRSAKLAGDSDEAKALPDDVAVNARGGPDADLHHPAAATSIADEEAGRDGSPKGRIEPLRRAGPPPGRS